VRYLFSVYTGLLPLPTAGNPHLCAQGQAYPVWTPALRIRTCGSDLAG
jgi:hypothetical protein